MSLPTMQDIGGCRSIVYSENQIRNIVSEFVNDDRFEIIGHDDYLTKPRDTGYSSYHLIVRPFGYDKIIEIQLRTRHQHQWATLVEITDLIYGIKLKEGEDHPDLYTFHKLLAVNRKSISDVDANQLIKIDNKLDILSKLLNLFKGNYLTSLKNWIAANPSNGDEYVIMILNDNLEPHFKFFNCFEKAEITYFELFTSREPNMVLIHINKPSFDKIGLAYSNYVLSSHPSIRYYLKLFQRLILELSITHYQSEYKEYVDYYSSLNHVILDSLKIELNYISNIINDSSKKTLLREEVLKDWQKDLKARIDYIKNSDDEFFKEFEKRLKGKRKKRRGFFAWLRDA